jgi:peptidoglycan/xylan/chitin deacetylase (PgdA/CDA1 family)
MAALLLSTSASSLTPPPAINHSQGRKLAFAPGQGNYRDRMPTRSHDRYPYSPINARALYDWPGGRRLAVYIALNLEWFSFGEGLGAELAPGGPQPDVLNYSWRDYGNRVGVFRLAELFAELKLPVSLLVNSVMYEHVPQAIAAFPGAEIVGHGRSNSERQGTLSESDEKKLIEGTTAAIEKHSGTRPRGWLGPWISQSHVTPDLLQEAGYTYLLDWCHDDQPTWMTTRKGRILSVPYPQELNDIPQIVVRKREGAEFADMIVDAFDVMHEECSSRPLVMGIALHPYIVGQPHRFKHLRRALAHIAAKADQKVWLTTSGEIAAHAAQLSAGAVP